MLLMFARELSGILKVKEKHFWVQRESRDVLEGEIY